MPTALEVQLKRRAAKLGLKGDRANAYVYGTMRKTGWKPGLQEGGIVDAGLMRQAEEADRVNAVRQHAEQEYWNQLVPEMDVLGAKVVKDYGYLPPVMSDRAKFARQVWERSLKNGKSPYESPNALERSTYGLYGATDPHTAMRDGPTVWADLSRARPFDNTRETYNHEFRHVALSPVSRMYEKDQGVRAGALEHPVIAALALQLASPEERKRIQAALDSYKEDLNDTGREELPVYLKRSRRYIDALQKGEPADIGWTYRNMPYKKVDTDVMEKDVMRGMRRFARGGIVSLRRR